MPNGIRWGEDIRKEGAVAGPFTGRPGSDYAGFVYADDHILGEN